MLFILDIMSFFHTYPNDVSLDDKYTPNQYMVFIEYYDDDNIINNDFIPCDSMWDVICLCDKLGDNDDITSINYEPIWNCPPYNVDQSPYTWTDW